MDLDSEHNVVLILREIKNGKNLKIQILLPALGSIVHALGFTPYSTFYSLLQVLLYDPGSTHCSMFHSIPVPGSTSYSRFYSLLRVQLPDPGSTLCSRFYSLFQVLLHTPGTPPCSRFFSLHWVLLSTLGSTLYSRFYSLL